MHEYDVETAPCIKAQPAPSASSTTTSTARSSAQSKCTATGTITFCTVQAGGQAYACTPVDSYVAQDGSITPTSVCWLGPMAGKTTAGKCPAGQKAMLVGGDLPSNEVLVQYGHTQLPLEQCAT